MANHTSTRRPSSTRLKRTSVDIPQNLGEADAYVGSIGTHQALIDRLEADLAARIADLKEMYRVKLEGVRKDRNRFLTGLFTFAEANKATLTEDGKTVTLTHGTISWRYTPPSVSTEDDAEMIETLKRRGLARYIRSTESLDRQALLADRHDLPRVSGLEFVRTEEFVVKTPNARESVKSRTQKVE